MCQHVELIKKIQCCASSWMVEHRRVPAKVKKLLAVCCTTTTVTSTVVEVDFMNSICIHDHECTPRSLGTYAWGTIKMANLDPKPKVPECCLREMLPIPFLLKTVRKFHKPVKWEEPHLHEVQRLTAVGLNTARFAHQQMQRTGFTLVSGLSHLTLGTCQQ